MVMTVTRIRNPDYQQISEQKELQRQEHDRTARDSPASVEPLVAPGVERNRCEDFVYADKVARSIEMLGDVRGKSVLVVCGGIGNYGIRELLQRGARVTLTDLSEETIARGRDKWRNFSN